MRSQVSIRADAFDAFDADVVLMWMSLMRSQVSATAAGTDCDG